MTQSTCTTQAGTLDPSFANDGVLNWGFPEFSAKAPQAVVSLPDGKLFAVSRSSGTPAGFVVVRLTATGELDSGTGFGQNQQGFTEISLPGTHVNFIYGISLLADYGVLITCQYHSEESLGDAAVRLLKDGRLDERFGEGGVVYFDPLSGGTPEQVRGIQARIAERRAAGDGLKELRFSSPSPTTVVEQTDGKIVLMTSAADYSVGELKGLVVRLNPDGTFDKSFNGTGSAFVQLEGVIENYGRGLAAQLDGQLVVFGEYRTHGDPGWYVTRFNADGKQDVQFSTLMLPNPGYLLSIYSIAVREKDGLIALVGGLFESVHTGVGAILVLNRDGAYNLVFNQGKPLYSKLMDMGQQWSRCAFGSEGGGRLILSGTGGSEYVTDHTFSISARYLLTGELDLTFNKQGWVVFDDRDGLEVARDMAITADGRIVVCGEVVSRQGSTQGGWITRYLG
ncbi:hypothetical protein [Pseudomonas sp. NPDC087614]|uniref:hypothetical protein n=1 Tax=Pseudomonas sp. NPDC087614 TaxID=3364442 RepID=UPI0038138FB9